MKTSVHCYIYDSYYERGMKSFENKVAKILKDNSITGELTCLNAWKERASGYGQYYNCLQLSFNGRDYYLKSRNTDSEAWDNWEEPTTKDKRDLFLAVLENEMEDFKQQILDEGKL